MSTSLVSAFFMGLMGFVAVDPTPRVPVEAWDYAKLTKRADLIVIVRTVSSADVLENSVGPAPADCCVPVATSFKVVHVIKGEWNDKKLSVLHYRLKEGHKLLNPPAFVRFESQKIDYTFRKGLAGVFDHEPEYLLYLRKRKDAYYELVSAWNDAEASVRLLLPPP